MLFRYPVAATLALGLVSNVALADLNTFFEQGMTTHQAVQASAQQGQSPNQILLDAIDHTDRLQLSKVFETLLSLYPQATTELVYTAIQLNMNPALVVAIATAVNPSQAPQITRVAIESGADPLEVVTNTIQTAPDSADEVVAAALTAAPDIQEVEVSRAAILGGADPSRVTEAPAAGVSGYSSSPSSPSP